MNHIFCPACGFLGRRLRRRNRRAADAALIRFHAQLAAEARRCTRCPDWVIAHDRGYCLHAQVISVSRELPAWSVAA